jgi:hypothetical protein
VRSSILINSEPGNSEIVARGFNDGMGELSVVDPFGFVASFIGVSVFGDEKGKVCPCFMKASNDANTFFFIFNYDPDGCRWLPTYSNCLIVAIFQFGSFFPSFQVPDLQGRFEALNIIF